MHCSFLQKNKIKHFECGLYLLKHESHKCGPSFLRLSMQWRLAAMGCILCSACTTFISMCIAPQWVLTLHLHSSVGGNVWCMVSVYPQLPGLTQIKVWSLVSLFLPSSLYLSLPSFSDPLRSRMGQAMWSCAWMPASQTLGAGWNTSSLPLWTSSTTWPRAS